MKNKGNETVNQKKVMHIARARRQTTTLISEVIGFIEDQSISIRENQCPVATKYQGRPTLIREYLVPISLLGVDLRSQRRRKGKNTAVVSSLSKQLEKDGQKSAICCKIQKGDQEQWEIIIRWGNHRWKAALSLQSRGSTILGAEPGYVWVSVFNEYYADHELNGLQTIENNLVEAKEPAGDEDNLDSLSDAWTDGDLDTDTPFSQMQQDEKEEQLKKWIKNFMGANVKQPSGLIKKFFKRNNAKIRTDTKEPEEHQDHWNLHESSNFGGNKFIGTGSKNNTFVYQGKVHAQYHMNKDFFRGATHTHLVHSKIGLLPWQTPKVDVNHVVVSLPLSTLKDGAERIKEHRDQWVKLLTHWNAQSPKNIVDYLYIMPQTSEEETASIKGTPWIQKIKF